MRGESEREKGEGRAEEGVKGIKCGLEVEIVG